MPAGQERQPTTVWSRRAGIWASTSAVARPQRAPAARPGHGHTPEKLAKVTNRILHPYTVEVKDVGWWAVYEIGQLRGTAGPRNSCTPTPRNVRSSEERQKIAKQVIDFDREFSKMFSAHPTGSGEEVEGIDPEEFQQYFIAQGRFTAGVATRYARSYSAGGGGGW